MLRKEPGELSYLQDIPADDLRTFREQVTDLLFDAHSHVLSRLIAASKLLPVAVVATIGERAFGPVLSARVAGMLEPARGRDGRARCRWISSPKWLSRSIRGAPAT